MTALQPFVLPALEPAHASVHDVEHYVDVLMEQLRDRGYDVEHIRQPNRLDRATMEHYATIGSDHTEHRIIVEVSHRHHEYVTNTHPDIHIPTELWTAISPDTTNNDARRCFPATRFLEPARCEHELLFALQWLDDPSDASDRYHTEEIIAQHWITAQRAIKLAYSRHALRWLMRYSLAGITTIGIRSHEDDEATYAIYPKGIEVIDAARPLIERQAHRIAQSILDSAPVESHHIAAMLPLPSDGSYRIITIDPIDALEQQLSDLDEQIDDVMQEFSD